MKNQTKNIIIIIIILLVIWAVIWMFKSHKAIAPVETPLDTTASINSDLSQINIDNPAVDDSLKNLDSDLNTL